MANVLLFGPLADVLNTSSVDIEINDRISTILDLINELAQRGADWKQYLSVEKLQITVNRQFVDADFTIANSDEIAFISLPGTV